MYGRLEGWPKASASADGQDIGTQDGREQAEIFPQAGTDHRRHGRIIPGGGAGRDGSGQDGGLFRAGHGPGRCHPEGWVGGEPAAVWFLSGQIYLSAGRLWGYWGRSEKRTV